jgi:hypothetical protein
MVFCDDLSPKAMCFYAYDLLTMRRHASDLFMECRHEAQVAPLRPACIVDLASQCYACLHVKITSSVDQLLSSQLVNLTLGCRYYIAFSDERILKRCQLTQHCLRTCEEYVVA